jgi:hypothetical protein
MHLGVRHPRDRVGRDDLGVSEGIVREVAVASRNQVVGAKGAVAAVMAASVRAPPTGGGVLSVLRW